MARQRSGQTWAGRALAWVSLLALAHAAHAAPPRGRRPTPDTSRTRAATPRAHGTDDPAQHLQALQGELSQLSDDFARAKAEAAAERRAKDEDHGVVPPPGS